jgi:hypothetical protein
LWEAIVEDRVRIEGTPLKIVMKPMSEIYGEVSLIRGTAKSTRTGEHRLLCSVTPDDEGSQDDTVVFEVEPSEAGFDRAMARITKVFREAFGKERGSMSMAGSRAGSRVRTPFSWGSGGGDLSGPGLKGYLTRSTGVPYTLNLHIPGPWLGRFAAYTLTFPTMASLDGHAFGLVDRYEGIPIYNESPSVLTRFTSDRRSGAIRGRIPVRILLSPTESSIQAVVYGVGGGASWVTLLRREWETPIGGGSIDAASSRLNLAHKKLVDAGMTFAEARTVPVVMWDLEVDGLRERIDGWKGFP